MSIAWPGVVTEVIFIKCLWEENSLFLYKVVNFFKILRRNITGDFMDRPVLLCPITWFWLRWFFSCHNNHVSRGLPVVVHCCRIMKAMQAVILWEIQKWWGYFFMKWENKVKYKRCPWMGSIFPLFFIIFGLPKKQRSSLKYLE